MGEGKEKRAAIMPLNMPLLASLWEIEILPN
jgi:hypothetical protein